MKHHILIFTTLLTFIACSDGPKSNKGITLGDPNEIVTETDSLYLQNKTDDISPTNKRASSESNIAKMMTQVDSANSSKKLADESNVVSTISGLNVVFKECNIIFDHLSANKLSETENEASFKYSSGEILEMFVQVNDVSDIKVKQRIRTRLVLEAENEKIELSDLGIYTTQWFNLAGKDNRFVSLGSNSLQFKTVNQKIIKNALENSLRKAKRKSKDVKKWMGLIADTKSYSDAPCKLEIASSQWRIAGNVNEKRVQKTITIER